MKKVLLFSCIITFLNSYLVVGQDLPDDINISTGKYGIVPLPGNVDEIFKNEGFVRYTKVTAPNSKAIHIIAQGKITDHMIVRSRGMLEHFLHDFPGSQYGDNKDSVAIYMANNGAILMLVNGHHIPGQEPNINAQPLFEEEMAVEGSSWYINNDFENHRDATFEEILHLVHDFGIGIDGASGGGALKKTYQLEIRAATDNATSNNLQIWPIGNQQYYNELEQENSLTQEYLAAIIDVYYGLWGPWTQSTNGMHGLYIAKVRKDIQTKDPQGWVLIDKFFHPYLTYDALMDSTFEGVFQLTRDENLPYTYKSQYLQYCSLTGANNSGIAGNSRDNRFTGNQGDNFLDGRDGTDTAVFIGNKSEYTISEVGERYIITDSQPSRDGIDTLINIEFCYFGQEVIKLSSTDIILSNKVSQFEKELLAVSHRASSLKASFYLPVQSQVSMMLFNGVGKRIAVIVDRKTLHKGMHTVSVNPSLIVQGIYVCVLKTENAMLTRLISVVN